MIQPHTSLKCKVKIHLKIIKRKLSNNVTGIKNYTFILSSSIQYGTDQLKWSTDDSTLNWRASNHPHYSYQLISNNESTFCQTSDAPTV